MLDSNVFQEYKETPWNAIRKSILSIWRLRNR